ncbi:unnamed protein product [Bemisia tabaci]|uniref:Apolipophorins n=1 Tax=Bemisia tabaci TaxID=7038 RepID=A0A9P0F084_BEMTA|nr:unnamed protein product [Bemisia tabaci]
MSFSYQNEKSVKCTNSKCSLGCQGSTAPILKFGNGEVYKYQFEGSTTTHLSGAKGNPVKLGVSATAEISALPQCTYSLKLTKVVVANADDKKYDNLKELEAHPIQFSYQGGQVGTKVCVEEGDSHVSINIKRAIISLFQVGTFKESGQTVDHETDVFGICPTIFNYKTEGSKVTVSKTRNLNSCGHRETLDLAFLSTPYYSKSDFQSTPLLAAAYKSEQNIDNGVLKSASSKETYNYRPLASAESGAEITVETKLSFVSKAAGAAPALKSAKTGSIIFQAPLPADGISNSDAIIKALKEVATSVEPAVSFTAARSFGSLVNVLRHAKKADILSTFNQVKSGAGFQNKEIVKQIFLDALFRAGSSEAVEAGAELLKSKEISEANAKLWYLSFSFTKHASPAALKSVASILDNKDIPRQAYLGIGALANRHVREYGVEKPTELDALLAKLAAPLKSAEKANTIEAENHVIASLKGLQNVQYLSQEVATSVAKIAADPKVRSRIRSVAIETLKSDPCQKTAKETVTNILKNINEDSELRIKAYLALIQCPCSQSAAALKEIIDKEEIKQVGSFIVSHLRHLRASVNPDKFEQKNRYGGIVPARKFPINPAKYSHSVELSYLLDSLNVGIAGDANVIYSQHSFIPRSYSLNLTTHVFGQAFNLFDLDIRNENLDFLLEKYFGPRGHFKRKDMGALFEDGYSKASGIIDQIKERYQKTIRPKRAVAQADLDALAKKVDLGVDAGYNGLDLDVALKVFGTEITWLDYHSDKSAISSGKLIDEFFDGVDASIDKAKNFEYDYKKHFTFLDNELSYPTGLGFPLKVKALGSSAISVKFDGKLDIPALIKDPQNANIRFQLIPSGAVEVSALLTVDAYAVESGIKLATTVHSATGVDVTAKILEGYGIDVKLGLPVKIQDVVNIKSEVFSTSAVRGQPEVDVPVKFDVKRQEFGGCFDQLSPIVGLTFCGIVQFPWDGYKVLNPIFGPTKVNLRIEKEDDTLTSYNFRAYYNTKKPNARSFEIILDTPNSQTNRKLALLIDGATEPKKSLSVSLDTPFKKVSFSGFVTDTEKETSLTAKFLNDDAEYFLRVGADISGSPNSRRYEPILEYRAPEGKERLLGRNKGASKDKKQQLSVEGAVIVDKKDNSPYRKYTFSQLAIITQRGKYVTDGTIVYDTGLLETDLKVTNEKIVYVIKNKAQKLSNNHYKADAQLSCSQYPDFALAVNWEYKRTDNHVDHTLIIVHGADPKSTSTRLSLIQSFDYKTGKDFEFGTKNKLTYPVLGIEGKVDVQATPKSVNYEIEGAYENQKVSSKLNSKVNTKEPGDFTIYFDVANSIVIESKREVVENRGKSLISNSVTLTPGGKYALNGAVIHKFAKDDFQQGVDIEITMPQDPKSVKIDAGYKRSPTDHASHAKITAGSTNYVDFAAQLSTAAGKPKGNFKLYILSVINSNGVYSYDNNKCTASLSVDIPKLNRGIEGKAELTHSGGKAAGFAELQYDAKKDPSKKIRLETNYDVNKDKGYQFNSKNLLFVNADKYTVNLNFGRNGLITDGQVSFDSELILPSTRKYTAKYSSDVHLGGSGDKNFKVDAGVTHAASKDAQPCKVHLKVSAKNIDFKVGTYDGQSEVEFVSTDQKDMKINVSGKKTKAEDINSISGQVSVQGSLVSHPFNGKFESDTNASPSKGKFVESNFHLALAAGSEFQLNAAQKITKESFSHEISGKFPQTGLIPLTSVKFSTVNNFNSVAKAAGKPLKIKSANSLYYTDKTGEKYVKLDGDYTEVAKGGIVSLQVSTNEITPRQFTGSYHYDSGDTYKGDASLAIKKGEQEGKIVVSGEIYKTIFGGSLKISGQNLAGNGQGSFDLDAVHKYNKEKKSSSTDIKTNANGKAVSLYHLVEWNSDKPVFDLSLKIPTGENRFYVKGEKKDAGHYTMESKINWIKADGGGSINLDGEGKFTSFEDFFVKYNIDSPKLNLNKIHVDVANKPSNDEANKITFSVRSAEKNIVSGNSNYKLSEEGPKVTLEGSGTLKVDAKSYPMTFSLHRQKLSTDTDGEEGKSIKFNFESKELPASYNGFSKYSNKEVVHKHKYCYKDQCDKVEAVSKVKSSDALEFEHELNMNFDLGLSAKVQGAALKATTTVSAKALTIDQNVALQLSPTDKLQYQVYVHKTASGVVLTLPKRVIAAEATYAASYKPEKAALKYEGALWLDKPKANTKTSISFIGSASRTPGLNIERPFVHFGRFKQNSGLGVEIDIFAKKTQKITIDSSIIHEKKPDGFKVNGLFQVKSKGQNLDSEVAWMSSYEKGALRYDVNAYYIDGSNKKQEYVSKFEASKEKFDGSVKVFDQQIFTVASALKLGQKDYYAGLEKKYEIFGRKYEESGYIYHDGKFKYIYKWISAGDKSLEVNGGIAPGKVADFNVYYTDGAKSPILEASIALDEANFLKPTQKFNADTLKPLAALTQTETMTVARDANKKVEAFVKEVSNEILRRADELKKAQPNFKAISQNFDNQLKTIRTEIANDKVLKEIADSVKSVFHEILELAVVAAEEVVKVYETIAQQFEILIEKLNETLKKLAPQLVESYAKISQGLLSALESALKLTVHYVEVAVELFKKLEPEIKELLNIVNKFAEDIGKVISKAVAQVDKEVRNFIHQLVEQVKNLPVYGMLREKWEELQKSEIPEKVLSVLHEVAQALKDSVPTEELKKLIEDLEKFIEKILRRKPVDNAAEFKILLTDAQNALKSILPLLPVTQPLETTGFLSKPGPMIPLPSFEPLSKLHQYTSFSFSPIQYLKSADLPSLGSIVQGLQPLSLNYKHFIPPHGGWGILVDGAHFFTFDKRHYTFKGTCSYVLAQDYKDSNFSLSADLDSGKLKALTLNSGKDSLVMLADGTVQLNGKPSEYPAFSGELSAWRRYHTVNMRSNAGVMAVCSLNLDACAFHISGYYFDKVRGLLGTLNNEDYDDFTLPNNKISTEAAKFANAYKVGSCADAPEFVHQHASQSSECNAFFASDDASLLACKPFVDTAPFREACEHSVSSATDKNAAACKIAAAYVGSCFERNIPVELPETCGTPLPIHQSVSVKVPQKTADVVVVVEQLEGNQPIFENLLTPLISTLTSDFKEKGITDVNFALIGYTSVLHKWPIHYSSKGKLTFDGKPKVFTFAKVPTPEMANTFLKQFHQFIKAAYLELRKTDSFTALYEAYEYPFRADAVKVIIHAVANPERHSPSYYPTSTLYPSAVVAGIITRVSQFTNVLVIPTPGMTLQGGPASDVVGFNNKAVYKADDAKASPLVGNHELSKELRYPPGVYTDFTRYGDGLVVSADNFIAAKPDVQKQSVKLISKFIVQSSADQEQHKECKCVLKYGLFPETECHPTFFK